MTPLSTWGVSEREKKALEDWFPLGRGLLGVASVSLGNQDELARHLYRNEVEIWKKKSMCVLFNVKLDTVQKDYIMYVW